jgi:hypothetical protein
MVVAWRATAGSGSDLSTRQFIRWLHGVAKEAPPTIVGLFVWIIQLGYCFQCSSNFSQLLVFASISGSFHLNTIIVWTIALFTVYNDSNLLRENYQHSFQLLCLELLFLEFQTNKINWILSFKIKILTCLLIKFKLNNLSTFMISLHFGHSYWFKFLMQGQSSPIFFSGYDPNTKANKTSFLQHVSYFVKSIFQFLDLKRWIWWWSRIQTDDFPTEERVSAFNSQY